MQNHPECLLALASCLRSRNSDSEKIRSFVRPSIVKLAEDFANAPSGFQFNALVYNWSAKDIRDRLESKNYELN